MASFSSLQLLAMVLLVVISSLLLSLSHCDAHSTTNGSGNNAGGEEIIRSHDDIERLVGRKIMLEWTRRKVKKTDDEDHGNGNGGKRSSSAASKNSGASSVGISNNTLMKREVKMEKMMSISTSLNHHHTKIMNPSGFMALNADYHMARPHPPRNN